MGHCMIRLEGLTFGYEGRDRLFTNLKLKLDAGDCVLLQGENGSGKSTLLKLIRGLLKPLEGSVYVAGKASQGLAAWQFNHLHYLSQNIGENILGSSPQDDWEIWRMALPNLPAFEFPVDMSFSAMSSGQLKQHAQRILPYLRDRFWLLDEPFSALDAAAAEALLKVLEDKKTQGGGFLLVAHELKPDARYLNRVLSLNQGQLQELT